MPKKPAVSLDGPTYAPENPFDKEHGDPVGIAVNGVLIVADHTETDADGVTTSSGIVKDFDNCGGHSDKHNRYHYHAMPICLMRAMFEYVPDDGTAYVYEDDAEAALAHWPATAAPSAMLGWAMDGFPIYGPYDDNGELQIGLSSTRATLDECNFNHETQRYHMTPNAPYVPPCTVGERGAYSETLDSGDACPANGVGTSYCKGDRCEPESQECTQAADWTVELNELWWITTCLLLLLMAYFCVFHMLDPDAAKSPITPTILSCSSAFFLLLLTPEMFIAFFGVEAEDGSLTLRVDAIQNLLNEAVGCYLSVAGVVYGLVVAQFFGQAQAKFTSIRQHLTEEVAGLHRVLLLVKAISVADNPAKVQYKLEAYETIRSYIEVVISQWGGKALHTGDFELLYSVLPTMAEIVDSSHGYNVQIADRAIDSLNDVLESRYQRYTLENQHFSWVLWVFNGFLSTSMFFGVALIVSGSAALNFAFCYCSVVLIGCCTYVIADMDYAYTGIVRLDIKVLSDLHETVVLSKEMKCAEAILKGHDELDKKRLRADAERALFMTRQKSSVKNRVRSMTKRAFSSLRIDPGVLTESPTSVLNAGFARTPSRSAPRKMGRSPSLSQRSMRELENWQASMKRLDLGDERDTQSTNSQALQPSSPPRARRTTSTNDQASVRFAANEDLPGSENASRGLSGSTATISGVEMHMTSAYHSTHPQLLRPPSGHISLADIQETKTAEDAGSDVGTSSLNSSLSPVHRCSSSHALLEATSEED